MAEINPYIQDVRKAVERIDFAVLDGSNVLVTGATGLIGGCLVDMLMLARCQVYALGRNEARARRRFAEYWDDDCFHFVKWDVAEPMAGDTCFDYIIHAASNASPNFFKKQPVEVMMANILGVRSLMDYGLTHGMRRMLYVSSGEVYGEGHGASFTEIDSGYVDCATPRACYPSSKRAAETLCVAYTAEHGADVVIARPCHTYGPYFTESDNRVYAQFVRNVINGEDIVLKSKGEQYRSWIYVVDCATALLTILTKGACGEAYNVADAQSNITIKELADIIAKTADCKVTFDIENPDSATDSKITKAVFETSKLESLGWSIEGSMIEKIGTTVAVAKSVTRKNA